jgi:hypothetical protein
MVRRDLLVPGEVFARHTTHRVSYKDLSLDYLEKIFAECISLLFLLNDVHVSTLA